MNKKFWSLFALPFSRANNDQAELNRISGRMSRSSARLEKFKNATKIWANGLSTAGPRLTRILGPEKNRVRRNRTIGGLWDYTI